MKTVLNILKTIKNTSGTNDKITLLSEYKNNELLLSVLNLMYNPTIATNLASKKIVKDVGGSTPTCQIQSDCTFVDFLSNTCTGKDSDVLAVQQYVESFTEGEQVLLREIACQSLSIGMDYKNINKGLGFRFINVIQPMLATDYSKVVDKLNDNDVFYFTEKLDGNRVLIKVEHDSIKAFSRNGLELDGYNSFLSELDVLPKGYVYDGELLPSFECGDSQLQYKTISKITRTKGEKDKESICFNIFDAVPIDEFGDGESNQVYSERRYFLDTLSSTKYFKVVPILLVSPFNDNVYKLLDEVVGRGKEGLMANANSTYVCKRTKNILKLKQFKTCDILCTGLEEGDGAFKGMLGSLICNYKGFELNVGSGFTQEQRKYYWENKNEIIGKLVELKYFEESTNDKGGLSLRFPIFKWVRDDKTEESYD